MPINLYDADKFSHIAVNLKTTIPKVVAAIANARPSNSRVTTSSSVAETIMTGGAFMPKFWPLFVDYRRFEPLAMAIKHKGVVYVLDWYVNGSPSVLFTVKDGVVTIQDPFILSCHDNYTALLRMFCAGVWISRNSNKYPLTPIRITNNYTEAPLLKGLRITANGDFLNPQKDYTIATNVHRSYAAVRKAAEILNNAKSLRYLMGAELLNERRKELNLGNWYYIKKCDSPANLVKLTTPTIDNDGYLHPTNHTIIYEAYKRAVAGDMSYLAAVHYLSYGHDELLKTIRLEVKLNIGALYLKEKEQ